MNAPVGRKMWQAGHRVRPGNTNRREWQYDADDRRGVTEVLLQGTGGAVTWFVQAVMFGAVGQCGILHSQQQHKQQADQWTVRMHKPDTVK